MHSFNIIKTAESTNNYLMDLLRSGKADHGVAWFCPEQTAGKGQRGKSWVSEAGSGISLSIAIRPGSHFSLQHFHFNALVALACFDFLKRLIPEGLSIKWPNDLYWRDRKAGGILIENIVSGKEWKWSAVGLGINVNQMSFPEHVPNAVSLRMIRGVFYDVEKMARELHRHIMQMIDNPPLPVDIMNRYNENLYMRNNEVKLAKNGSLIKARIFSVDENGKLITGSNMEEHFSVGDVVWK